MVTLWSNIWRCYIYGRKVGNEIQHEKTGKYCRKIDMWLRFVTRQHWRLTAAQLVIFVPEKNMQIILSSFTRLFVTTNVNTSGSRSHSWAWLPSASISSHQFLSAPISSHQFPSAPISCHDQRGNHNSNFLKWPVLVVDRFCLHRSVFV